MLIQSPHPLLDLRALSLTFPRALGELNSPPALTHLLRADTPAPMSSSDEVRRDVRDLLRHGGFKPTGRSKPASEYLIKAAEGGFLGAINPAVDLCNVVSLHSGLPISVVDPDRAAQPLHVDIAPAGSRYVFNAAGQEIDAGGLICLFDAGGPCANPVKDSQRTKTHEGTRHVLALIWGTTALPGRSQEAADWFSALATEHFGAEVASAI